MSSLRRPPGPVRQLSLQQPPRRQQVRRQRSAEEDKPLQIYANPIRTKLGAAGKVETERPKVRIAWTEQHGVDSNQVEVIARQIPNKSRPPTAKPVKIGTRATIGDKATILYSRQELAERLRLAWKQREENKSNIDIFLAHNALSDERCDSQLSTCTTITAPPTPAPKLEEPPCKAEDYEIPSILINSEPVSLVDQIQVQKSELTDFQYLSEATFSADVSGKKLIDISRVTIADEEKFDLESKKGHVSLNPIQRDTQKNEATNEQITLDTEKKIANYIERNFCEVVVQFEEKEQAPRNNLEEGVTFTETVVEKESENGTNNVECIDIKKTSIKINCLNESTSSFRNLTVNSVDSKQKDQTCQETSTKLPILQDKDLSQATLSAKIKRANFHNCTNKAFVAPIIDKPATKEKLTNCKETTRRTSSAPPQRRLTTSTSGRTQVSIVIDAPSIAKPDSPPAQEAKLLDRKDTVSPTTTCNEAVVKTAIANRAIKSAPMKRRAKSGKRRVSGGSGGKEGEEDQDKPRRNRGKPCLDAKTSDVVTMVSLVSSADSDSDIDQNSSRDDKLIYELRSKLPTTPIIKTSGCPAIATAASRKPIKSVSFQQDSLDAEREENAKEEKKVSQTYFTVASRGKCTTPPSSEETTTRKPDIVNPVQSEPIPTHAYDEPADIPVTDREKRCLAVPIGDLRDKKRKLLRTRSTPPRPTGVERQPVTGERSTSYQQVDSSNIENNRNLTQQTLSTALVENSISKVDVNRAATASEANCSAPTTSEEPQFQTIKEKECWHLYRRMRDKGVYVSFDTVLRGMLTPTEYRLRQREVIDEC